MFFPNSDAETFIGGSSYHEPPPSLYWSLPGPFDYDQVWSSFSAGWCNQTFAHIPMDIKHFLLDSIPQRVTVQNTISLLFEAQRGLLALENIMWKHEEEGNDSEEDNVASLSNQGKDHHWTENCTMMINFVRQKVDKMFCGHFQTVLAGKNWPLIIYGGGSRGVERVEWLMDSVRRGISAKTSVSVFQVEFVLQL
jgi:hypothetical protein